MFGEKFFPGAFETKCSVKSAFQVLLRRNVSLKSAFKVLLRRNVSVKSAFKVLLRRNAPSKVLLKFFCDEMFLSKCS